MTSAHVLYIPTIFLLGLLAGMLIKSQSSATEKTKGPSISGIPLLTSFLIFMFAFIGTHFFHIPRSSHAVTHALNGQEIFDKKPSYTSGEVYSRISSFPEAGISLYQQFTYTIDVLFPITLFAFLILLSRYISKNASVPKRIQKALMVIPAIWFSLDMLENGMIYSLLNNLPSKNLFLAGILGYVTISKFTFLLFSIATPALIKAFERQLLRKFGRGTEPVVL